MKIPHAQRFISILAVQNANHKRGKNLEARVLDYERMISGFITGNLYPTYDEAQENVLEFYNFVACVRVEWED